MWVYVGVCGCMWVYTHTRTHCTDGVLGCEPRGRDATPGGPEESRSTEAQYTCRLYKCTKYICLLVCWAAGFDDLGELPFFLLHVFSFEKSSRCDDDQQTTVIHFGENKRLHHGSSK